MILGERSFERRSVWRLQGFLLAHHCSQKRKEALYFATQLHSTNMAEESLYLLDDIQRKLLWRPVI